MKTAMSILLLLAVTSGLYAAQNQNLVTVQTYEFSSQLKWFGQVVPTQAVRLSAHTAGRITAIHVDDGALVVHGDLLMTLGGREIEARYEALTKQLQAADDGLQAAKMNLQSRQSMFDQQLANRAQLSAAGQALAQAAAQRAASRQALQTLDAAIHILAPIDGRFTDRAVNSGQYVSTGATLGQILNPEKLRIEATLFPPTGLDLTAMQALIAASAGTLQGGASVTHVFPASTQAGGVKVWIEGADLTGMHVGAMVSGVLTGATHLSLAVPASAIARNEQGQAFVFVQTPEGLRQRAVTTATVDHGLVEITAGLQVHEQVLSEGAYELLYGDFDKRYQEPD